MSRSLALEHRSPFALWSWIVLLVAMTGCSTVESGSEIFSSKLRLTSPADRLVYQRGLDGAATILVDGSCAWLGAELEARLSNVYDTAPTGSWQKLGSVAATGAFIHPLRIKAGWHRLEVRARFKGREALVSVAHVGVGEVFIVVGHSVAHGGRTNLAGATDDRVNTIAWPADSIATRREYERTAEARLLPELTGAAFTNGVIPAPFGNGTYFWAQFAERVAKSEKVPVLLLNAAFGGTSLQHWAMAARGERFEHSFVKSDLRMPYINLAHALQRYASVTGVRALLADQGQNDWPEPDAGKVFTNYLAWVEQARRDAHFAELAVVVNRQTPPGHKVQIRRAQERMIREVPHCFAGPDYDTLANGDRYDGIHLSETGMARAAELWAEALTPAFFQRATPCLPSHRE